MESPRPPRTFILTAVACAVALGAATLPIGASPQLVGGATQTSGAGPGDQGRGRANVQTAPLVATSVLVGRVIDAATGEPVAGATVNLNGGPPRSAPPQPSGVNAGRAATPPTVPPRVLTDGQGRFAFRQLVRGNYSLSAEKIGYTGGAYGRTRPNGPSRPLQLDDNESMPDLVIRIFKLTSISGRVVDDAGEPIVSASVRAYRRIWTSGQRVLAQTSQVSTDDRGMYRIHNLTPGEYIVSVPMTSTTSSMSANSNEARQNFSATQQGLYNPSPMMSGGVQVPGDGRFYWQPGGVASLVTGPDGRWRAYATQYFPMSREVTQAEPIVLTSGQERTGVDFAMTYLPTSTISGMIVGSPKPASNWVLRLVPTSSGEFTDEFEIASAVSDGGGAFVFAGIPPGNYVIQTLRVPPQNQQVPPVPPPPPPSAAGRAGGVPLPMPPVGPVTPQQPLEPLLWGATPITVGDADIAGVGVPIREGLTIAGRLEFQGSRARPDAARMAQIPIVIEPANGRDRTTYGPPMRTQADGRFVSSGKLPGRYFVRVGGAPAGWIVHSINANGVDATERPIDLTQSINNVVITFTDLIGSIRGTLRSSPPEPDPPAVLLFPADPAGWREFGMNPARFRQTRAGPNGEFNFASLAAGDYLVIGIKEEYSSEWQNPAYTEALARVAQRVTLTAGEQRVIDINLQDVRPPGIGRRPPPIAPPAPVELPAVESPDGSAPGSFFSRVSFSVAQSPPAQAPTRDTRAIDPVGFGSISGQVTDAAQKTPLRLARISVRGGALVGERNAITDAEGRYIVRGLPAGDYQVIANKPAYILMSYGARLATPSAGTTVKLAAGGALTNIDIALTRGGVITGMIHDANGQPAPLVSVQALSYSQRDGERILTPAGSAQTDDRGMYRMFGLRPMKYIVLARPPGGPANIDLRTQSDDEIRSAMAEAAKGRAAPVSPAARTLAAAPPDAQPTAISAAGRSVAVSPVLYPGVLREQDAQELVVGPGQELSGIDFRLELVAASRVSGVVIGPDGQPARNARMQLSRMVGSSVTNVSMRMTPDGTFDSQGVAPGTYRLVAQVPVAAGLELASAARQATSPSPNPVPAPRESLHFAVLDLDLFGNDAVGLVLQTAPPLSLSGRVVMAGPATDVNFRQVTVRLEAVGRPTPGLTTTAAATPDATGVFTIQNVMPGRFRLVASGSSFTTNGQVIPGPTHIASSINGVDALLVPFEITDRSLTDAVVTMTAQPAEISGKLIDGRGAPVPDLYVVLFPTDSSLWTMAGSRAMRSGMRSQADGSFRFPSVLPREYFLAVLTELDALEWGTAAYMEQLAQSAIKVNVGVGEKKVQDIKLSGRAPTPASAPAARPSR